MNRTGYQKVTADAAVSSSGAPVVIYGLHIKSAAGGAGNVILYDGTSTSDTEVQKETGVTDQGKSFDYPEGKVFPLGCFVDIDANVSYVAVWFEKV